MADMENRADKIRREGHVLRERMEIFIAEQGWDEKLIRLTQRDVIPEQENTND